MNILSELREAATLLGSCEKIAEARDIESAAELFWSPQGIEFCERHQFPSLDFWRQLDESTDLTVHGIYVDKGRITLSGDERIALIGNTFADISYSKSVVRHQLLLMCGAGASVVASDYAVVAVTRIGSDTTLKVTKDKTSFVI